MTDAETNFLIMIRLTGADSFARNYLAAVNMARRATRQAPIAEDASFYARHMSVMLRQDPALWDQIEDVFAALVEAHPEHRAAYEICQVIVS